MLAVKTMRALWREGLSSAFRTALACTIVGSLSLHAPPSIATLISFPAFSYVTAILIIFNHATLGDAMRGCCLALYATMQTLGPAMFTLWLLGPGRLSKAGTAVAVALAAFVVVLPWPLSAHLVAKRLALGQIVLVYVVAYDNGVHTDPLIHPLRLAASTALGVLACVVALLLPYPRLACSQVTKSFVIFYIIVFTVTCYHFLLLRNNSEKRWFQQKLTSICFTHNQLLILLFLQGDFGCVELQ